MTQILDELQEFPQRSVPEGVPPKEFPGRTGSVASAKAQLHWSCAYKSKAGILQDETVWANAAKLPPEAWHEMYVPGQVDTL